MPLEGVIPGMREGLIGMRVGGQRRLYIPPELAYGDKGAGNVVGPDEVLVFKVMGKMFVLVNLERMPLSINVKCEPARALELREEYDAVQPGYHMNKKHWNTVELEAGVPGDALQGWIDDSYALVVKGLRKKDREALKA